MKSVRQALTVLLAALREIFDEAAYMRFLSRSGLPSSASAYAKFCRERDSLQARRHRCC